MQIDGHALNGKRRLGVTILALLVLFWSSEAISLESLRAPSAAAKDAQPGVLRLVAEFNLSPRDASVVKWGPDGRVATGGLFNDGIQIFDVNSRKQLLELKKNRPGSVALGWSPDGRLIAAANSGTRNFKDRISVLIWDAQTGAHLKSIVGPYQGLDGGENDPVALAFSPDNKSLAVGYPGRIGIGGTHIYVYEVSSGRLVGAMGEVKNGFTTSPIVFSPDGLTIVEGTNQGEIRIWDIAGRTLRRTIKAHAFSVSALTYSPDGKWIASATKTGESRGSLDETTGQLVMRKNDEQPCIWEAATGKLVKTLSGYASELRRGLQFSPDGRYLVSSSYDKTVKVWSTRTWELAYMARARGTLGAIDVSANSRYIAVGGQHGLTVWQMER